MIKLAKLNGKPEIFHSIQGEGKSLGRPSVFVRLSLCNLYCIWCDTDYTWNWENTKYPHLNDELSGYKKFKKEEQMVMLPDEEIISEIIQYDCDNIILTGGEPLVQQKELERFVQQLREAREGLHIEIETNGTLIPSPTLDQLLDQYNVSVKLSNSAVEEKERLKTDALQFFSRSVKANFKFVVNEELDLKEIQALQEQFEIDRKKIYLMPQGRTVDELTKKRTSLEEICKREDYHFTDRLHIHLYGNQRGV